MREREMLGWEESPAEPQAEGMFGMVKVGRHHPKHPPHVSSPEDAKQFVEWALAVGALGVPFMLPAFLAVIVPLIRSNSPAGHAVLAELHREANHRNPIAKFLLWTAQQHAHHGHKMHGIVQMGAAAHVDLINNAVAEVMKQTGWTRAQVLDAMTTGWSRAEGKKLDTLHAKAFPQLHGLPISVGRRHGSAIGDFFAQFDPTWPKAKFGGFVRQAIIMAAGAVGIQAGPIIDSFAGMAQKLQPPEPPPGAPPRPPPPPKPLPPIHPAAPLAKKFPEATKGHPAFKGNKWTTQKKVLAAGSVLAVLGAGYVLTHRKTNPRRRRRKNARGRGRKR